MTRNADRVFYFEEGYGGGLWQATEELDGIIQLDMPSMNTT